MPRPKNAVPQYLLHRPSGKARCRIDGRDFYLGDYGSEDSRKAYAELIRQHFAGTLSAGQISPASQEKSSLSVAELALSFIRHAETFYLKDGKPTSEIDLLKSALRPMVRLFGETPAVDFGPLSLKAVRAEMVSAGWVRSGCNQGTNRIRRMFRFAVENELVPEETLRRLRALTPLMRGKTEAPDRPRRSAVPQERIDAVLAVVPPMVADMIRIQELIGCRPSELLALRPELIDRTEKVWVAKLEEHKTEHHGHERRLYIGPRAQKLLKPYLEGRPTYPVFPMQRTSYCRAVVRGCEIAFGMPEKLRNLGKYRKPKDPRKREAAAAELKELRLQASAWRRKHCWSPHWLRHCAAARIREAFGIEAVQATLGHSTADMSEHYAGLTHKRAIEAARKLG